MPSYYRQSPTRKKGEAKRKKRRAPKRRFQVTAPAILDVRKLRTSKKNARRVRRASGFRRAWRRIRRHPWRRSHVLALLMLVMGLAGLIYGVRAPRFTVYAAEVSHARYTNPETVLRRAYNTPSSIFLIDADAIRARVLELPHVRDANVTLRLPAEMRIEVIEREPIVLYQVQNESFWIDEEGVVSPAVTARDDLIKLIDENGVVRQNDREIDSALLEAILYISQTLPEVNTFRYQEPYGLFFFSPEGWRVLLGSADNMREKLSMWEAMRRQILQDNAAVQEVDLRYSRPYWR
ncbi:MAG: FtsQ-type POTRA domain-containing protein [Chloroflexi bacterium]|nr:FtsQ-type POTRA domain-containing protein [Chloroflexota bacterium]